LPRESARLQVLDKVNARTQELNIRVGQTAQYGTLSITVRACLVRPPNFAQDAAAELEIDDKNANKQAFAGWMFAAEPSLFMLEHPVYDVRIVSCQ